MTENWPDDGRKGKGIDCSLVIPSITRPTWEPPALEVLHRYEVDEFAFDLQSERMKSRFPDIAVRIQFVDLMCEMTPLAIYGSWAARTLQAARESEDQEKISFYQGLSAAIEVDLLDVWDEPGVLYKANNAWLPLVSRLGNIEGECRESGNGTIEFGSTTPKITLSDNDNDGEEDESSGCNQATSNLNDIYPLSTHSRATTDITARKNGRLLNILTAVSCVICFNSGLSDDKLND